MCYNIITIHLFSKYALYKWETGTVKPSALGLLLAICNNNLFYLMKLRKWSYIISWVYIIIEWEAIIWVISMWCSYRAGHSNQLSHSVWETRKGVTYVSVKPSALGQGQSLDGYLLALLWWELINRVQSVSGFIRMERDAGLFDIYDGNHGINRVAL